VCLPNAYRCGSATTTGGNAHVDHEEESCSEHSQEESVPFSFKSIAAAWVLKIKEGCKLTQSSMDQIIQGVTDLIQYILAEISLAVKNAISEMGMEYENVLFKWQIW
jgi:hypothetical protein